jgi:hypothetical protein
LRTGFQLLWLLFLSGDRIIVLLVLWVFGLVGHIPGALINILVVVALISAIIWLVQRISTKK